MSVALMCALLAALTAAAGATAYFKTASSTIEPAFQTQEDCENWLYSLASYIDEFLTDVNSAAVIEETARQIGYSGDIRDNDGNVYMTIEASPLKTANEIAGNDIYNSDYITLSEQSWNAIRSAFAYDTALKVEGSDLSVNALSNRFYTAYGFYPPCATLTDEDNTITVKRLITNYPTPSGAPCTVTQLMENWCNLLGTVAISATTTEITFGDDVLTVTKRASGSNYYYLDYTYTGNGQYTWSTGRYTNDEVVSICPILLAAVNYQTTGVLYFDLPIKVYNTYAMTTDYNYAPNVISVGDVYSVGEFISTYDGYVYPNAEEETGTGIFKTGIEESLQDDYIDGKVDTVTQGRTIADTGAITGDVTIAVPDDFAEIIERYIDETVTRAEVEEALNVSVVDTTDASVARDATETINGGGGSTPVISTPVIDVVDSGFISIWNPTRTQINSLANYMWDNTGIEAIKKFFDDPMDSIISLALYPVAPPISGTGTIKIGYTSTGISGVNKVSSVYGDYSCGTKCIFPLENASRTTQNFSGVSNGAFYDYSPYTKAYCYLPFIGVVALNATDIMRKYVSIDYHIEFLTGSCLVTIKVQTPDSSLNKVLYTYTGNCMMQLPLTGSNFANIISKIGEVATGVGQIVGGALIAGGTAGIGAGVGAGMIASGAGGVVGGLNGIASDTIQRGGGMSGNSGFLGTFTPYIILERPKMHKTATFNHDYGRYTQKNVKLSSGMGFTMIKNPHIEGSGFTATEQEKQEIYNKLSQGVIL